MVFNSVLITPFLFHLNLHVGEATGTARTEGLQREEYISQRPGEPRQHRGWRWSRLPTVEQDPGEWQADEQFEEEGFKVSINEQQELTAEAEDQLSGGQAVFVEWTHVHDQEELGETACGLP